MKIFLFLACLFGAQNPVICSDSEVRETHNRALMCNFHHAINGRVTYPLLFAGQERFVYEAQVLDNAFRILGVCISKDRVFRRQLKSLNFAEKDLKKLALRP